MLPRRVGTNINSGERVLVESDVESRCRCFHNFNLSVLWKAIRDPHQLLVFARGDDDFRVIAISISLYFTSHQRLIVGDNTNVDARSAAPLLNAPDPTVSAPVLVPTRSRVNFCRSDYLRARKS